MTNTPNETILLDGGMGQELYRRGLRGEDVLWSANALRTAPDQVRDIHLEFINAGARIITTNTYCTHPARLRRVGAGDDIAELNDKACEVAIAAREMSEHKDDIKIAASLPPQYSYRPDLEFSYDQMFEEYSEMVELLRPHIDIFLCETMTNPTEAKAAITAAANAKGADKKPIWCAWTMKDDTSGCLRSGDTLQQAISALDDLPVDAFLANCSSPESVTHAIKVLAEMNAERTAQGQAEFQTGGYANGFTPIPEKWGAGNIEGLGVRENLGPEAYYTFVQEWIKSGATIVGGCCEISPAHIAYIHKNLR